MITCNAPTSMSRLGISSSVDASSIELEILVILEEELGPVEELVLPELGPVEELVLPKLDEELGPVEELVLPELDEELGPEEEGKLVEELVLELEEELEEELGAG
jgi:hypothetical protein